MPLSAEVDKFVKVASARLPRVSEIIAAFPDEDRAGAFEFAERRYAQAARDFGCDEAESKRWGHRSYAQAACTSSRRKERDLTLILGRLP
jgi:hypothetical protein